MKKLLVFLSIFVFMFTMIPVSFASSDLPDLPTEPFEDTAYFIFYDEKTESTFLYYADKRFLTTNREFVLCQIGTQPVLAISKDKTFKNNDVWLYEYKLVDNSWSNTSTTSDDGSSLQIREINISGKITSEGYVEDVSGYKIEPIASNIDIYRVNKGDYPSNGTTYLFFPQTPLVTQTLAEIIQEITNKEMTMFQTETGGTITTLVLCGVGCLALLMVLPLFGKVLKRYLPQ